MIFPLFFILVCLVPASSYSCEQTSPKQIDRIVEGDLFRIPRRIEPNWGINTDGYEITVGESEPCLYVWATTKKYADILGDDADENGSCNWSGHTHPHVHQFPDCLPLNLFLDENYALKKEGDTVNIFHNNPKTKEYVKIILTLCQKDYRYSNSGDGKFDDSIRATVNYNSLIVPYLNSLKKSKK